MNEETKHYVEGVILEYCYRLPESEDDWYSKCFAITAADIMAELCEALDIYTGDEE